MSGLLGVEPLLADRLSAKVGVAGLRVLSAPDLDGMQAASQPVPAVHLVFGGFERMETEQRLVDIVETWLTVVVVRNARAAHRGADTRADAGSILDAVFAALNGWQPAGYRPLQATLPPRGGYDAGFGYFPLAWRVRRMAGVPCPGGA